jgi:arylsulfatase A-like enzyme
VNFVFICIDTLRYDHLSCNGNDWIRTPNFEAFAREAVVFDNSYAGSFPTIPHRTDTITGRFGRPLHPWQPLAFDAVTLPRVLAEAGWATALICDTPHLINGGHAFDFPFHAWHFERGNEVDRHLLDDRDDYYKSLRGPWPASKTYLQYMRNNRYRSLEEEWPSPRTFRMAGDFVEMCKNRDKFFFWVDTFDPHEPWDPPEHYVRMYDDTDCCGEHPLMGWEPMQSLTPEQLRHEKAHYAGEVTMVDRHLGRFLERLSDSGRDRDTVVIITCDHGTNLGSHGVLHKSQPIYDQVGHLVMMVRMPGVKPCRRAGIVQPADTMPTILDLAGLEIPETCQGRSFAEMIKGEEDECRDVAVSGGAINPNAPQALLTVQDKRWCLIDHTDPANRQLYDKQSDPEEEHNIIAEHPEQTERLHQAAVDFLKNHEAHESIIRWFETGEKGDTSTYQQIPPRPGGYHAYWQDILGR